MTSCAQTNEVEMTRRKLKRRMCFFIVKQDIAGLKIIQKPGPRKGSLLKSLISSMKLQISCPPVPNGTFGRGLILSRISQIEIGFHRLIKRISGFDFIVTLLVPNSKFLTTKYQLSTTNLFTNSLIYQRDKHWPAACMSPPVH